MNIKKKFIKTKEEKINKKLNQYKGTCEHKRLTTPKGKIYGLLVRSAKQSQKLIF